jgi:hypothetical protein
MRFRGSLSSMNPTSGHEYPNLAWKNEQLLNISRQTNRFLGWQKLQGQETRYMIRI